MELRFPAAIQSIPLLGNFDSRVRGLATANRQSRDQGFAKRAIWGQSPPTTYWDASSMAAGIRNIRLFLSRECFGLMAEAMCEHAKRSGKFQTIHTTVERACAVAKNCGFARAELDLFLAEYVIEGDRPVWLKVTPHWAADFEAMREATARAAGGSVHHKVVASFAVYLALTRELF
jgi:hypothetical protein